MIKKPKRKKQYYDNKNIMKTNQYFDKNNIMIIAIL